jgi:hypothetical protein
MIARWGIFTGSRLGRKPPQHFHYEGSPRNAGTLTQEAEGVKAISRLGIQPPNPSQNALALEKNPSDSGELFLASVSNSLSSSRCLRVRFTGVSTAT